VVLILMKAKPVSVCISFGIGPLHMGPQAVPGPPEDAQRFPPVIIEQQVGLAALSDPAEEKPRVQTLSKGLPRGRMGGRRKRADPRLLETKCSSCVQKGMDRTQITYCW
jgi:hypothetical protein